MAPAAVVAIDLQGKLTKMPSGKVRERFKVNDESLLLVASDRMSAFDVVMENVSPSRMILPAIPRPGRISIASAEEKLAQICG